MTKTVEHRCQICQERFIVRFQDAHRGYGRTCTRSCAGKLRAEEGKMPPARSGEENPHWKGGRTKSTSGYWLVRVSAHPRRWKSGYVKRATLVLEQKLGRFLRDGEIAHHIDGNKENDDPGNLEPQWMLDHTRYHNRERSEEARRRNPPQAPQPDHPANKRYIWPPHAELLEMRSRMSLRQLAHQIGCGHKVVDRRIKKLKGVHWSQR